MFVPIIAGSDKTTVSVATGHQEYHPVYMSPGNISNVARRAHGNAVLPVAFLPIPKSEHSATLLFLLNPQVLLIVLLYTSKQKTTKEAAISEILPAALSRLLGSNFPAPKSWNDSA